MSEDFQLLTAKQVCALANISHASLYRWTKAGNFPRQVKIGPHATRWRADEVMEHLERLTEARDASARAA